MIHVQAARRRRALVLINQPRYKCRLFPGFTLRKSRGGSCTGGEAGIRLFAIMPRLPEGWAGSFGTNGGGEDNGIITGF